MDLDTAADELYGMSPEEFVGHRQRLVAEARKAKERELAKEIGQLRKPTRTGWLVNVLARAEPDRVTELLDLGPALADAQQRRSWPDLRRLSAQRRTVVDALARRALELGRDLGYTAPDAARQEVAQTLQAALGDAGVADLLRRGRLTQATSYGGFPMMNLGAAPAASNTAASTPAAEPETEPEGEPGAEPDAVAEERRREAEQRRREAEEALEQARTELETGQADADRATAEADELADQVESLRTQLREAEAAEEVGRTEARAARHRFADLRRAVDDTEQAVAEAGRGE